MFSDVLCRSVAVWKFKRVFIGSEWFRNVPDDSEALSGVLMVS